MNKVDIFKKVPEFKFEEKAIKTNPEEFCKVVESRRSVRVYTDEKIPEEIVKKCLDLTLLAPNSSNLQTWEFYWVRNKGKKEKLVEYCLSQPAAATAAELIVCVARPDHWKKNNSMMLQLFDQKKKEKHKKYGKMTGKATRSKIDRIVSLVLNKNKNKNKNKNRKKNRYINK